MKSYKKSGVRNGQPEQELQANVYKNELMRKLSKRNYNYLKMNVNSLIDQAMNSGLLNSPYGMVSGTQPGSPIFDPLTNQMINWNYNQGKLQEARSVVKTECSPADK